MSTINVIPAVGATAANQFSGPNSGNVTAGSDGTLTIDSRDILLAIQQGLVPTFRWSTSYSFPQAPVAANNALLFASAAAANGTLAIAGSVDVPRQVQAIFWAGTAAVTAGTLALTYAANDGTAAQVDSLSLICGASAFVTVFTTKGVVFMSSMALAGIVGGASPTIEVGTNAVLALPIAPSAVDMTLAADFLGGTAQATKGVVTNAGFYTPNSAPNGTRIPTAVYAYSAPSAF
jgi:hypothetical protein